MTIDVTHQTIALFPELRDAAPGLFRQGVCKKSFHAEDVYSTSAGRSCEPTMILFSQFAKRPHSCVEPLAKNQALEFLTAQVVPDHDEEGAGREFPALSKLVQQTACNRLHFGQDVLDLPWLITPLLERH